MRLGTLALEQTRTTAVVVDDGHAAPVPGFADGGAVLAAGERGLQAARDAVAAGRFAPFSAGELRAPVLRPGAVVCVGLNYRSHILEMGRELPTSPTLFSKLPRAITDPYGDIVVPPDGARRLDYEGELGVVIGQAGRDIAVEDAWHHVAGLTVVNDITMRDYQKRTLQWFAGKTWEQSTPVGPAIVTSDELGPVGELRLVVEVNGVERQRAVLGDLVFGVADLVADLSRIVTVQPGDIIATGTPGGVGEAMDPKGYLQDGDVVEVSIDGIGTLRNRVRVRS
jgi:acylpyruvate hydrolase